MYVSAGSLAHKSSCDTQSRSPAAHGLVNAGKCSQFPTVTQEGEKEIEREKPKQIGYT